MQSLAQVILSLHELETQVNEIKKVVLEHYDRNAGVDLETAKGLLETARFQLNQLLEQQVPEVVEQPVMATQHSAEGHPIEWVVRVWKSDLAGTRGKAHSSSHTYDDEAKARDFFTRSVTVHQAKARRGESSAYVVVLATQDPRKWMSVRRWHEVEAVLVDGSR